MGIHSTQLRILVLIFVLAVFVAIFGVWWFQSRDGDTPIPVEDALLGGEGDAVYTDLAGNPVALEEYFGVPLIINTWASWSPLSRDELVALNEVAANYDSDSVRFIALNRKETKEQAARFLATLPALDHITIVIDANDNFYNRVGGYAMPETVVFTESGDVYTHERTPQSKDSLTALVEQLLTSD